MIEQETFFFKFHADNLKKINKYANKLKHQLHGDIAMQYLFY